MSWLRTAWFRWIDSELRRPTSLPNRDDIEAGEWNQMVGRTGERLAGKFIHRSGGKVLYRNYQPKNGGEIDIIYRDDDVLVFAEVKTRTSLTHGRPAEAVNRVKQRLLIRGANAWLRALNHPEVIFRFDIVEVTLNPESPPEINIIKEAFTTPQAGLGM